MNDIVVRNMREDLIKGGDAFLEYCSQACDLTFLDFPEIGAVSFGQDAHLISKTRGKGA